MADNPLSRHFRRSQVWLRLPSGGRWYDHSVLAPSAGEELQIRGVTAVDDMLLNTPDALFNGHALVSVLQSCVPELRDVRRLVQPDVEALLLGIKAASNGGKFELSRICPHCKHENTFDVVCTNLLNRMTYVEDSDTQISIDDRLVVHLRPYSYDDRSMMIRRQLIENRTVDEINAETDDSDPDAVIERVARLADSVERMARLTYGMLANAVTAIELRDQQVTVTDRQHIEEWLNNIDRNTADAIARTVQSLNEIGPPRSIEITCQGCGEKWEEPMAYDPTLFFTRP